MHFAGLGWSDVEGNEVRDWPGAGDRDRVAEDGAADVLFVFGGCTACSMPLLTSSWTVSIAELFPSRSNTPI